MKVTKELVDYVAQLSRLELTDEQNEKAQKELGAIIDYADTLNNVNTDGIEPLSHVFAVKNVMREDVVKESRDRDELLSNAPMRDEEAFLVPKTVE